MTLTPTIVAPVHTGAPKLEPALFTQAATLIAKTAEDGGFHGPSIDEFFPDVLFSVLGVPVTRIHLIQFIATIALVLFLWAGTRRMRIVPGRFQSIAEMGLDFASIRGVRNKLFGDSLLLAEIHGPGHVWLQSMTPAKLAAAIEPYLPNRTSSSSDND